MKKIILLFAGLLSTVAVNAQQANLVWAKAFAASNATGYPSVYNSVIEPSGSGVLVGGDFKGAIDFDPSANSLFLSGTGVSTGFLAYLNAAGDLQWAKSFQGSSEVRVQAIQEDAAGNIYIAGVFKGSVDLNPDTVLSTQVTSTGDNDVFIAKLNGLGNFIWGRSLGNAGSNSQSTMMVDGSGFLYLSFNFKDSIDADPGTGVSMIQSNGMDDAIVVKMDGNGAYVSAFNLGGPYVDAITDLKTNNNGELLITARVLGTLDVDPGTGTQLVTISSGNVGGLVLKLSSTGQFVARYVFEPTTSPSACQLDGIGVDAAGNMYVNGNFSGTIDFDPGAGTASKQSFMSTMDMFVAKLSSAGVYQWCDVFGANYSDYSGHLAVLPDGHSYMLGQFGGTIDLDPDSVGTYNITATTGNFPMYECIVGLNSDGSLSWGRLINGYGSGNAGRSLVADGNNTIYECGYFGGTLDFDPNNTIYNLSCPLLTSGSFVLKLSNAVTGIEDMQPFSGSLYPNPADDWLWISTDEFQQAETLLLYDAKGTLVRTPVIRNERSFKVDVRSLPAGLYLGVLSGNRPSSFRFIVSH